jgi:hypothetical protein
MRAFLFLVMCEKQQDREGVPVLAGGYRATSVLEKADSDLAQKVQAARCVHCTGRLDRSDYERKPRGGPEHWNQRESFCCAQDGCRKRHTPPSVRFFGRKVYVGTVVILISAMRYGLNPGAARLLGEKLGVDRRTLQRWRCWWLDTFVQSPFWKAVRARFMPSVCEKTLPASLCEAFDLDRLGDLLKFLAPITTGSMPLERLL